MSVASAPHAPAFFLAHATPMLPVVEPSGYTDALRGMAAAYPRPKAVVIVSARSRFSASRWRAGSRSG